MRQLVALILVIVAAVVLTMFAQENPAKVTVFFTKTRLDFSLNFAILSLLLGFTIIYLSVSAVRISGQLPGRFKQYLASRKQNALLDANTAGLIALITGDETGAEKALENAIQTGVQTDLSYLIRAMSALQANRLDVADKILSLEGARQGTHSDAVIVLQARVALAKTDYHAALSLLDGLDPLNTKRPQVQRIRLLALTGQGSWENALLQYRSAVGSNAAADAEYETALGLIYRGLAGAAGEDAARMQQLLVNSRPDERMNIEVLKALSEGLIHCGLFQDARKILEAALERSFQPELLPVYHQVAVLDSRQSLPFVEKLVMAYPDELRLLELAAQVCECEQLLGKAIALFESVYTKQASAHIAGRLERLYEKANQNEKAKIWRDRFNAHLVSARQLA